MNPRSPVYDTRYGSTDSSLIHTSPNLIPNLQPQPSEHCFCFNCHRTLRRKLMLPEVHTAIKKAYIHLTQVKQQEQGENPESDIKEPSKGTTIQKRKRLRPKERVSEGNRHSGVRTNAQPHRKKTRRCLALTARALSARRSPESASRMPAHSSLPNLMARRHRSITKARFDLTAC